MQTVDFAVGDPVIFDIGGRLVKVETKGTVVGVTGPDSDGHHWVEADFQGTPYAMCLETEEALFSHDLERLLEPWRAKA